MTPFWTPLSALLLEAPPSFAPCSMLRRLLAQGRAVDLLYAGDRMWPALRHGERVRVHPLTQGAVAPGTVVLAAPEGIPDLLRVIDAASGQAALAADADPTLVHPLPAAEVMGTADLARRRSRRPARLLRRLLIDAGEALRQRHDPDPDPAGTVRLKYETQAPFYGRDPDEEALRGPLIAAMRRLVPPSGRILVAGSGAGWECLQLAGLGWQVVGVDFAPAMVAVARSLASGRGLPVAVRLADLRRHHEPEASLDAVLFTYDCYSFVPGRAERVAMLRRMRGWLRPAAPIFLSAWRVGRTYGRLVLTAQWLAAAGRGPDGWGRSHTRWIAPDGSLHRSYKVAFTQGSLRREARAAGLRPGAWEGGHVTLLPA